MIKNLFRKLVYNDLVIRYCERIHKQYKLDIQSKVYEDFFNQFEKENGLAVVNGPFAGMKYASRQSIGSTLIPKLLGTYEHELHHLILKLRNKKSYKEIIDIGAAEGYYAVGFSMLFPNSEITTFEISEKGQTLMKKMIKLNDINNKINIYGKCTPNILQSNLSEANGLIICDCEGYEKKLLIPKDIPNLKFKDLLVELHDYSNDGETIAEEMQKRFKNTHNYKFINIQNNKNLKWLKLNNIDENDLRYLLDEKRKYSIGWVFLEAKL